MKAAFIATAPTSLVGLRPVDGESTFILASRPIVDDLFVGDIKNVRMFLRNAEHTV
jgi:hypothetical protein